MTLTSLSGRPIEAEGRAVGGRAVLRLRDVSGIARELTDLSASHEQADGRRRHHARRARCAAGAGVGARRRRPADLRERRLCARGGSSRCHGRGDARTGTARPRRPRPNSDAARAAGKPYAGRLPAIVAGQRRIFDVVDAPSGAGSAGMAIDRTEAAAMRAELDRMIEAHRRVLDQLATGVAIFNVDRKLTFYNTAFRSLFELDAGFLDQTPTDSAVLDRLRSAPQAARGAGFPAVEAAALRGLPRGRAEGAHVAPAGRAHACASSPRPIRKAASPISTTTSPSGSTCTGATTR